MPSANESLPAARFASACSGVAAIAHFAGAAAGDALHHVDELVGERLAAARLLELRRDVDRHERRVEAARHRARMVEVPLRRAPGDVLHLVLQPVGNVDVGVDDQEAVGELLTARRERRLALRAAPAERQKVREQAVGARHAGRQLAEEGEAGVDVGPLAEPRHQQPAALRRLVGILELEERRVGRLPGGRHVESALLHPALPVGRTDPVGGGERGVIRDQELRLAPSRP